MNMEERELNSITIFIDVYGENIPHLFIAID